MNEKGERRFNDKERIMCRWIYMLFSQTKRLGAALSKYIPKVSITKLSPSFYLFGSLNCHIPNNEIIPTSQNLKFDKDSRVTIIYDSVFVFLIINVSTLALRSDW